MKQNVTIKQINELTDISNETREKWFKWLIDKKYLTTDQAHDAMNNLPYALEHVTDASNIGRMIEFLRPQFVSLLYDGTVMDENLCDELWEAIKVELARVESITSKLGSIVEYDLENNKKICTTCRKEIIKIEKVNLLWNGYQSTKQQVAIMEDKINEIIEALEDKCPLHGTHEKKKPLFGSKAENGSVNTSLTEQLENIKVHCPMPLPHNLSSKDIERIKNIFIDSLNHGGFCQACGYRVEKCDENPCRVKKIIKAEL